jgi:hypothetical protein
VELSLAVSLGYVNRLYLTCDCFESLYIVLGPQQLLIRAFSPDPGCNRRSERLPYTFLLVQHSIVKLTSFRIIIGVQLSAMSEVDGRFVKRGLWTNLEHGKVMGKTITTDSTTGTIVIAVMAILSTVGKILELFG